jgi:hypothetical protein
MYFFIEYLTDKEKKHSADFERNTQQMCLVYPLLIEDIQEYLKRIIPVKEILETLANICEPVKFTEISLMNKKNHENKDENKDVIPIGIYSKKSRKTKRKKNPRLIAWPEENPTQYKIQITKNNRIVSVPVAPLLPDGLVDEDDDVIPRYDDMEPSISDRLPKIRRSRSRSRSRGGGTKKHRNKK